MSTNMTRLRRQQVHLPDLEALVSEVADARGEHDSLADLVSAIRNDISQTQSSMADSVSQLQDSISDLEQDIDQRISDLEEDIDQRLSDIESRHIDINTSYQVIDQEGTVVTLPFTYTPGQSKLLVFRNGLLQSSQDGRDYTESAEDEITFTVPLTPGETVFVMKMG